MDWIQFDKKRSGSPSQRPRTIEFVGWNIFAKHSFHLTFDAFVRKACVCCVNRWFICGMLEHNIVVYAHIKTSIISSMSINNAFDEWDTSKTCETHAYLAYAKMGEKGKQTKKRRKQHPTSYSQWRQQQVTNKKSSTLVCVHRVYALIKLIVLGYCYFFFLFGKIVTLPLVCFNRNAIVHLLDAVEFISISFVVLLYL